MTEMLISVFKASCVEVLNAVQAGGESVVVTRRGRPLARIVPLVESSRLRRQLGASRGEVMILGDIVHAGFEGDWESLR